ncbi:MAG: flagellar protein [Eubacterium sp.]|nr:flagellar protein [Eubacterium sp.]
MEVRSCKMCKKLFNCMGRETLCPACRKKEEEKFQEVKKYIEENKGASVDEVAKDCEVPSKIIYRWVREERLILSAGSGILIECEICGKPIVKGKYCPECAANMANELNAAISKPAKEPVKKSSSDNKQRMRFLDN